MQSLKKEQKVICFQGSLEFGANYEFTENRKMYYNYAYLLVCGNECTTKCIQRVKKRHGLTKSYYVRYIQQVSSSKKAESS